MMDELPPLREVIEAHGLWAKKSLGQHFLLDTNLLSKIVHAAGDLSQSHVIEVGPGPGGLTRAILAANPGHLTAIEKDARCLAALAPLKEKYPAQFTLMEADALKVRVAALEAAIGVKSAAKPAVAKAKAAPKPKPVTKPRAPK